MERSFRHRRPEEKDVAYRHHEIQLSGNEGGVLAKGMLEYFSRPFPFYYVSGVASYRERQGNGGELVREINAFLKQRNKAGLLLSRVGTLYEREGWQRITQQSDWWSYNLPRSVSETEIAAAIDRVNKHDA